MKKLLILFFVFYGFINSAFSQTVNDIPLKDIDVEYIEIVGTSRALSDKINIQIDFGQNTKFFGTNKTKKILDETGEKVKFNSMIDALNFMNENGYKFVQAYAFAEEKQNVYHYLMKKEKNDKEKE